MATKPAPAKRASKAKKATSVTEEPKEEVVAPKAEEVKKEEPATSSLLNEEPVAETKKLTLADVREGITKLLGAFEAKEGSFKKGEAIAVKIINAVGANKVSEIKEESINQVVAALIEEVGLASK